MNPNAVDSLVAANGYFTVVGWRKVESDAKKMNYYHQRIAKLEEDGRLGENDLEPLGRIRREVLDTYSKGKEYRFNK